MFSLRYLFKRYSGQLVQMVDEELALSFDEKMSKFDFFIKNVSRVGELDERDCDFVRWK
jgi:hypothetical protein